MNQERDEIEFTVNITPNKASEHSRYIATLNDGKTVLSAYGYFQSWAAYNVIKLYFESVIK